MGKTKPFFCENKGCKFSTKIKMLVIGHQKLRCPFAKKRVQPKKKSSAKLEVDLSEVEIGAHINTGGYGSVFEGKIGNLEIAIKMAKKCEKERNASSLAVEKNVYQEICAKKMPKGFPRFFGFLEKKGVTTHLFIEKMDFNLEFLVKTTWGNLNIKEQASIMLETLMCLKKLHQIGFLHRDLKLNNIMIKGGNIHLIDFGGCLYLPGNTKTSIFGCLSFLHSSAHLFGKPAFQHDIETIGWMFMHVNEPDLPWDPILRRLKKDEITFHEAAPIVGGLKEEFLKNETHRNPFNSFIFECLHAVKRSKEESFPSKLYDELNGIIMEVILNKDLIGNPYGWKKIKAIEQKKGKYGLLIQHDLPNVEMGTFSVFALPQPIIAKYRLKEELTLDYVRLTCSTLGSFEVLDLCSAGQRKMLDTLIKSPKLFIFECLSDHFSVYVATGKGGFISFDGMGIMEQLDQYSHVVWRNVDQQKDVWESGYRALFWIFEVLRCGSVENWISEIGF